MTTVTIGMDLGDRKHQICVLDEAGDKVAQVSVDNTATPLRKYFGQYAGALVAMETGTHSPWVSRLLASLGCRVLAEAVTPLLETIQRLTEQIRDYDRQVVARKLSVLRHRLWTTGADYVPLRTAAASKG